MARRTNVQRRSSRWDGQEEELRVSQLAARSGQQGDVCWGIMGGSGHHGEHAAQVARFYSLIEKKVPTSLLWDDTSCEIDLTAMLGSELLTIRNYFATHYESVQIVWLPYLNLNNFPLFTPTGVIKPGAEMKVMWGRGIVGSILGWHKTSRTKLLRRRTHAFCQLYDR
ncbi:hypothetical protein CCR75_008092 [Bremia lactucae]|uniref:Uncharacterized protein n=1 Tax=Bremia lactucae TaxID=4779 RepID=A0A976IDT3_BRELC|nr:hypothetical protein CCR75_008092 [Bremia lactucae]